MKYVSIKKRIIIPLLVLLLLHELIILLLFFINFQNTAGILARTSISIAENQYNDMLSNKRDTLIAVAETASHNEEILKAFSAKDRDRLYEASIELYENLNKAYRISQFNFLEDSSSKKCFLRMQDRDIYGDTIERKTYNQAILASNTISGFELGVTGYSLRVIKPIDYNGATIGYLEIGEEVGSIFDSMKKHTGNNYGLFLDKKYLTEEGWANLSEYSNTRNNWNDFEQYVLTYCTSGSDMFKSFCKDAPSDFTEESKVIGTQNIDNKMFVGGALKIKDYSNETIGTLIVVKDITSIYRNTLSSSIFYALVSFLVFIVLVFGISFLLKRLIFSRIEDIIFSSSRIVGGDYKKKIIVKRNDEIGRLEDLLEQLRQILINLLKK